jgi:NAD(P)-dependent dehydrogenase (short-subunit alcohol dehydrogenase family)
MGPFVCSREAARHMAAHGGGVIVNIGSIAGHVGQQDASVYTMSKAALTGLTRATALELGHLNIRVVQVDPGDIQAAGSDLLLSQVAAGQVRSGLTRGPALGRRGTPDDIAATVGFLSSPKPAISPARTSSSTAVTCADREALDALYDTCRELGLPVHVDGSRLFNAATATRVPPSRICAAARSVTICFSKGLGCRALRTTP